MTFMRIWTALLAGSCAGFISTLFYALAIGLTSSPPLDRQALYDVFLLAWLLMTALCAVPAKPLRQWLAGIAVSAILSAVSFLLALLSTREPVTLVVTVALAVLLVALYRALARTEAERTSGQ